MLRSKFLEIGVAPTKLGSQLLELRVALPNLGAQLLEPRVALPNLGAEFLEVRVTLTPSDVGTGIQAPVTVSNGLAAQLSNVLTGLSDPVSIRELPTLEEESCLVGNQVTSKIL